MSQRSKTKKARLSQQKLEQSFSNSQSNQNVDELVQSCVRFFVLNMSSCVPIQKAKIVQQVFKEKPGKQYDLVLKTTAKLLDKVLLICNNFLIINS